MQPKKDRVTERDAVFGDGAKNGWRTNEERRCRALTPCHRDGPQGTEIRESSRIHQSYLDLERFLDVCSSGSQGYGIGGVLDA
jgi:hypothetical protein